MKILLFQKNFMYMIFFLYYINTKDKNCNSFKDKTCNCFKIKLIAFIDLVIIISKLLVNMFKK